MKTKDKNLIIGLDFDGTVVKHEFPAIGEEVPNCIRVLKRCLNNGYRIILNTMRSDRPEGNFLSDAVKFLEKRGIQLYGINENPTQKTWTTSPKIYAQIYIDDAALGCTLIYPKKIFEADLDERPYVDWLEVEKLIFNSVEKP